MGSYISSSHCPTNKIYICTSFLVCKTFKESRKNIIWGKNETKQNPFKWCHRHFIHSRFSNSPFHIPSLPFRKKSARLLLWVLLPKLALQIFAQKPPVKNNLLLYSHPNSCGEALCCDDLRLPYLQLMNAEQDQDSANPSAPFLICSLFCLLMSFALPFQSRLNIPTS